MLFEESTERRGEVILVEDSSIVIVILSCFHCFDSIDCDDLNYEVWR